MSTILILETDASCTESMCNAGLKSILATNISLEHNGTDPLIGPIDIY